MKFVLAHVGEIESRSLPQIWRCLTVTRQVVADADDEASEIALQIP